MQQRFIMACLYNEAHTFFKILHFLFTTSFLASCLLGCLLLNLRMKKWKLCPLPDRGQSSTHWYAKLAAAILTLWLSVSRVHHKHNLTLQLAWHFLFLYKLSLYYVWLINHYYVFNTVSCMATLKLQQLLANDLHQNWSHFIFNHICSLSSVLFRRSIKLKKFTVWNFTVLRKYVINAT